MEVRSLVTAALPHLAAVLMSLNSINSLMPYGIGQPSECPDLAEWMCTFTRRVMYF